MIIGWTNYFRYSHFLTTNIAASMEQTLFKKLLYRGKSRRSPMMNSGIELTADDNLLLETGKVIILLFHYIGKSLKEVH